MSDTRAAPTAAVPGADRPGAPNAGLSLVAGRTPVFIDEVVTTGARPTDVGLGDTTPAEDALPLELAAGRVMVGLDDGDELVAEPVAGTPTTGTEVRMVGSESATLGDDPVEVPAKAVGAPDFGTTVGPDGEVGAGFAAANVNGVLSGGDEAPVTGPGSGDDATPADDVPDRMTLVGDSSEPSVGASDPPDVVVSVVASGVSGASVEAPTAPDFACVSVIDQSCSLGFPAVRRITNDDELIPAWSRPRPARPRCGRWPRGSLRLAGPSA